MYRDQLDEDLRRRYDAAGTDLSLEHELRLMRARLSQALQDGDNKGADAACAMVIRLARAQAAMGGRTELARMIDEVGESVVAAEEKLKAT